MSRLLLILSLTYGCAPLPRVSAAPAVGAASISERPPRQASRLGPFAGIGSGVRRIDAVTQ
jgi:hypothetical protein